MPSLFLRRPNTVAILAGLLSATGFAPLDWWPVALLCFAVWMGLTYEAPTFRAALIRSWLFGVTHFTVGNNWIQHAFDYQDRMPPALGYFAVVLLALYLAVYPMLAGGLAWRFASARSIGDAATPPGPSYVLVFAAAWIATEWLRATMFTGYSWNPLGVIWLPLIGVARLAAWTGTYALSGITILAAGALLLAVQRRWAMPAIVAASLTVAAIALSGAQVPGSTSPAAPRVRVVQPNIGQEARERPDYDLYMFQTLLALSGTPGSAPRLLLWPEGAVNFYLEEGYPAVWYGPNDPAAVRAAIAQVLGPRDIALVGGTALVFDKRDRLTAAGNSVFAIDSAGRLAGRYDKAHLVPYGEYLPMRPILERFGLSRLVAGDTDFLSGPGPRSVPLPGFGPAGMQVCYEIIFSGQVVDPARRPAFLFNPSNDAWFGSWGPPQHLAQARMRAIEEGLPILRSTPNGISAVIAADGRLVGTVPRHVAGVVDVPLPRPLPPTPFSRLGNWTAAVAVALLLLVAFAFRRRAR